MKLRGRRLWWCATACVAVVVLGALGLTSSESRAELKAVVMTVGWPRHFTPEQWKLHPDQRYWMARDLSGRKLLRGKTPDEVRQLLGPPAAREALDHWPVHIPSGLQDDLVVWFTNGKVEGWAITNDDLMGPQES